VCVCVLGRISARSPGPDPMPMMLCALYGHTDDALRTADTD